MYLTDTGEEAILLQEWLRLRMIRSQVSRVVDAGKWFCSVVTGHSHRATQQLLGLSIFFRASVMSQLLLTSFLQP